jgi:hypothetical protein
VKFFWSDPVLIMQCSVNKTGLKQGDPLSPILLNLALQRGIQRVKMVPSGIKIGKEQLNILAYAVYIALIGKNEIEIRKLFVERKTLPESLDYR